MCIAVYVAAPAPLPLIAWHGEAPAFYVEDVPADDPVRSHFSWPNVYYAGAHEGCGCGFAYNQMPEELQEPDDEARGRASVAALRKYVTEATAHGPVELYACWEGDQALPVKERIATSPDVLGGDALCSCSSGCWRSRGQQVMAAPRRSRSPSREQAGARRYTAG